MPRPANSAKPEGAEKSGRGRHEEVLNAGLRVFAQKGYRSATIEDIEIGRAHV